MPIRQIVGMLVAVGLMASAIAMIFKGLGGWAFIIGCAGFFIFVGVYDDGGS